MKLRASTAMVVGPSIKARSVREFELPRGLSRFRSAVEGSPSPGAVPEETSPGAEGLTEPRGGGDTESPPVLTK